MSETAQAVVKLAVMPVGYALAGIPWGIYRGFRGEGTPVNYARIVETYPHEGELTFKQKGSPLSYRFEDDGATTVGAALSIIFVSISSTPLWLPTRASRHIYETALETLRAGKKAFDYKVQGRSQV